jgi:glycosyltransferase involved in cell wall biosynthesis
MRPRVAMLAYACDPAGGGEHWLGWGWAEAASRFCDVTLFTPPKARAAVEKEASRLGIAVTFIEIPAWLRWCSERLGTAGLWWRKIAWAKRTAAAVRVRLGDFDIVHQTTFHTFRVPFYAASLGKPSVWGPMAGGEKTPSGFDSFLGASAAAERKRDVQNRRWLKWSSVQKALRDTSCIFASNRTTRDFLPEFAREKTVIVPPNTLRDGDSSRPRKYAAVSGTLKLIYAGNCVDTRSIPLVMQAMRDQSGVELTVAGAGPALESWKNEAQRIGLGERVVFVGSVPRETLVSLYDAAHALVFPALRDSGGSALLEAMSVGLPIVCLDWAGPGEMVDEASGIKIAVMNPAQVIQDLASSFARLRDDATLGPRLAEAAASRVRQCFTWDAKRALLESTYARLLAQ